MKISFDRKLTILFAWLLVSFGTAVFSEVNAQQDAKKQATPREARQIVNRINRIEDLPIKKGEPVNDKYAKAIVELGEKAAPYLIEKLVDRRDSRFAYLFQYKVGDAARSLLDIIYGYPEYPFPDGSKSLPAKFGDYRDYTTFFNSLRNRKVLQKSWREFIKNRRAADKMM